MIHKGGRKEGRKEGITDGKSDLCKQGLKVDLNFFGVQNLQINFALKNDSIMRNEAVIG